jgi:hypothetical protein
VDRSRCVLFSVETEFVALDVLHHETRLFTVARGHQSDADRSEFDQACAFGFERFEAFGPDQPGTDPDVDVHPVVDDLALGDPLEIQPGPDA